MTTACESGGAFDSTLGSSATETPPPPTAPIGNSALQISPSTYSFGLVAVSGAPASLTIIAQNITATPIFISSITGPVDPNFHVLSNNCPASTTAFVPGAGCSVVVQFQPVVGGSLQYQISAQFGTMPGDSSLHTAITLSGIGVGQLSFAGLNPIDPNQVTTTSVPLTWSAVAGASTYAIYKSVLGGALSLDGYANSAATSYTVQGLSPNASYVFQANAINTLGQPDSNTLTQLATTDTLGSFAALAPLPTSEGGNTTSGDIGLNCTDARGHYPSFMTLTSQSDPAAQCTLLTSPFRVRCQPAFKTGHLAFSSTLTVSCLLDAWPTAYVQTMTVNVADTDRAPILAPIGNQSVLAGTPIATVTPVASDPDSDGLTYTCQYDNLVDGAVAGGAATCASLLNQNGTAASFSSSTGVFAWTPPLFSSNLPFEVRITANDGFGMTSSQVFVLSIGEPPPDPAHSLVTVSSGSVTSGSSVTVTLTAKDPSGNLIPQGGSSVVFSNSGGASTGTFSATTDHGDGTYTATFTGVLSGSATAIHAMAQGSLVTTAAPSVSVSPGAISTTQSTLSVSNPIVVSGSTATVTLTAKDAAGNLIPTGGQTVVFSRSGGTSTGSFSGTTDIGNGTYTTSFTGLSAGSATTIGGTVGGSALTGTLPIVTVTPGVVSLSQSTLTVAGGATLVASGSSLNLSIVTRDSNGNALTAGGQIVTLAKSGGSSTGSFSAVSDNGNGTYSAAFTGAVSGTATSLVASLSGVALTSAAPSLSVVPGPPSLSQSTLAVGAASLVSGSSTLLTLTTRDGNGNALTTGGQTIAYTQSSGTSTGSITALTDSGNGTYTATFTGLLAGTATTLGATLNGAPITSLLPTVSVTVGPVSLAQSAVTSSSGTVVSGSSVSVSLQAKDAAGNSLTTGGRTVLFTRTGGTSTGSFSGTVDAGNGTYTSNFTGSAAGTSTQISATINGSALTSAPASIGVVPAGLSLSQSTVTVSSPTLVSGGTVSLLVMAKDSGGNPLGTGGLTVTFTTSGGASTGSIGTVTDNGNGTYGAVFTGATSGAATTLHATLGGGALTSTLPTITVTPGSLSLSQSTVTLSASSVASGATVTATASLKDANSNSLGAGGQTVVFTRTGGSSTLLASATTDNGNGTYTATLTGQASGTALSIGATVGGAPLTSAAPSLSVIPGALSLSQSTLSLTANTVSSGSSVTATLATKDAYGNSLGVGGQTVFFAKSGGSSTVSLGSISDHGDGIYTVPLTGQVSGTSTTMTATVGGAGLTSTLPTLTVISGALSLAQSSISVSSSTANSGGTVTLTLSARDAGGNSLGVGGQTVAFSRTGAGTSTGTIGSVIDNSNGTYTATFTAQASGTATQITASTGGSAVTSALPTITVSPGAVSLAQSLLSVSAGSVLSGVGVTVTLSTKDANGNLLTSGGLAVTFSRSGGGSSGTFSSITDNANGTYTATFTGTTSGSATTLSATIAGSAITSALPTVTVTPGGYSLAQSIVSLSATSILSGGSATLTLITKDGSGNLLTSGGQTVLFTLTGGTSAGTLSATTDNANGTYTATLAGTTSGSAATVSATINGSAVTSLLPQVTVSPGAFSLTQSLVSVSSGSVASGGAVMLTLTTKDPNGNLLSSGGQTVAFTRSGGTSTGSISATTDNGNGTYTAVFTAIVSGTATTIRASIGGSTVTSSPPTITVNPGVFSLSQSLLGVSSGTVSSGVAVNLTLTTKDSSGNLISSGGQTIAFSRSGGTSAGTFSSVTDNSNGTYSATFTGTTSGTATTLSGTINGSAITSTLPTVTVNPGALSLSQSLVSVSSPTLVSGNGLTLTLTVKDASGNSLSTGGSTVLFSRSGGSSSGTILATTDNGNGTYTATFTGTTSGSATSISASIGGASVTSTLPTVTVTPGVISIAQSAVAITGNPSVVASGSQVALVLTSRDSNGNLIPTGGQAIVFTRTGGTSTGNFGAVTDNGNGTYSSTFTGVAAGTANAMSATIAGVQLTSAAQSLSVVPGSSSLLNSLVTVGSASIASGSVSILTLTVKDGNGNAQSTGGLTVVFSASGGASTGTISATTDNNNGTYTATFSGLHAGSATTIAASIGGNAVTSTLPMVTVVPGPISLAQAQVTVSSSSIASGGTSTFTLTAKDANNNQLTSGGKTVVFGTAGGTSTGSTSAVTDNNNGTYSATFTGSSAGTATTLTASVNAATVTSTMPTITVNTGSVSPSLSTFTLSSSSLTAGGTATATLTLKDGAGNVVADSSQASNLTFSVLSTGTSSGTFGAITAVGGSAGTYQATFTTSTSGTANTLRAVLTGTGNFSNSPSFTVTSALISASQSTAVAGAASVTDNGVATSTITVTLKDAYLNLIAAKTVTLGSNRGGSDTISASSGPSNASGVVTFTVKSAVQGTSTYTAIDTTDGVTVTQAPTVSYVAGAVSPTLSTITATPATNVVANNVTTSSVVVMLLDSSSNPVSAKTVSLGSSRSSSDTVSPASAVTSALGQVTFTVASTAQGTSVLTATDVTDSNLLITPTASVAFIPGAVSQVVSTVVAATSSVSISVNTTITVTALDAYSNPVSGKTISLSSSRNGADTISPASQMTGSNGTVTFTVQSSSQGTSIFTAMDISDSIALSSTASIGFVGLPTSGNSTVIVTPVSLAADGTSTASVTVTLVNAALIVIPGKTVTITSSRGATDTISPSSGIAGSDGTVAFIVSSATPGATALTAVDSTDSVTIGQTGQVQFLSATPILDFQARLAVSGSSSGNNATPTNWWKNLYQTSTGNDGQLHLFANTSASGWSGSGTVNNPYALSLDGIGHSAYVDFGSSVNMDSSVSFESWLMPSNSSTAGSVILSNGSSSVSGIVSSDQGFTLKQSNTVAGALQLSIGSTSYADEVIADSPIGYWRLDEASGTTSTNLGSGGSNINGTYQNSPTLGQVGALAGDVDTAVSLTASSSQYIDLTNNGAFQLTTGTVEAWVKTSTAGSGAGSYSGIFAKQGSYGLFLHGNTLAAFDWSGPGIQDTGVTITDNNWHYVVFSFQSGVTNGSQIYLDGVSRLTFTYTVPSSTNSLQIGYGNTGAQYFTGSVDDAAIYSSPISLARIQAHYAARNRLTCLSKSLLSNTIWNFVTGVFNASGPTLSLFINGTSECSVTKSGTAFSGSSNGLRAGTDTAGAHPWPGSLSDIRLYGAALSSSSVKTNETASWNRFPIFPPSIAGLQLWLKADVGVTLNGSTVSSWADQSGNGYTASQNTTSKQPTYIGSALNGKPVLRFDGVANTMLISNSLSVTNPCTVFIVNTRINSSGGRTLQSSSTNWLVGLWAGNNGAYAGGWVSASGGTTAASNVATLSEITETGTISHYYLNGADMSVSTTPSTAPGNLAINGGGAYTEYSNSDVAEIIVYSTALSDSNRRRVEAYLNAKYNLY